MIRRTCIFVGRVQGVGFRATARQLAEHHGLIGQVRNCADGTVELIAEGSAEQLDQFVAELKQTMSRNITDIKTHESPARDEFGDFRIAR